MLIDIAEVVFKAGDGGSGITSFGKSERSGPDGGNGGKGGDVYLEASSDLTLLNQFSRKTIFEAENGQDGGQNKKRGANGKDLVVFLPYGTTIFDKRSGRIINELNKIGDKMLICRGGLGGNGNWEFKNSVKQAPTFHERGFPGKEKKVTLSLKLIADFGFVGLTNSGKSSLLNELTNAHAKTANYPFTTLSPILGVYEKKFLADIPGLIEGASEGKGLGVRFLKHIEKVGMILHCISCESLDLIKDYNAVRTELEKYSPTLSKKSEVILLTKTDLIDKAAAEKNIKLLKTKAKNVLAVSIYDWESIQTLKTILLEKKKVF